MTTLKRSSLKKALQAKLLLPCYGTSLSRLHRLYEGATLATVGARAPAPSRHLGAVAGEVAGAPGAGQVGE